MEINSSQRKMIYSQLSSNSEGFNKCSLVDQLSIELKSHVDYEFHTTNLEGLILKTLKSPS